MTAAKTRSDVSRRDFLRRLGLGTATAVGAGYGLSVWEWGGHVRGCGAVAGRVARRRERPHARRRRARRRERRAQHARPARRRRVPRPPTDARDQGLDRPRSARRIAPEAGRSSRSASRTVMSRSSKASATTTPTSRTSVRRASGGRRKAAPAAGGWLGTYLDGTVGFDDPLAAIGIGPGPSPALIGRKSFATTIADTTGLQPNLPPWADNADEVLEAWHDLAPAKIDGAKLVGQVQRAVGLSADARRDLDRAPAAASRRAPRRPRPRRHKRATRTRRSRTRSRWRRSSCAPRPSHA